MNMRYLLRKRPYLPLLLLFTFAISACSGAAGSEPAVSDEMGEMESMDESDHDGNDAMNHDEMVEMGDDHEHDDTDDDHEHEEMRVNRVPNEGAAIQISAPSSGDTFSASEQVIVEIETENFDLMAEGYHWHVYVDGESWVMVMGGNQDRPLTGLEPGEHMIEVYLSIPSHEELAEGDSIMINVTE